MEYNYGSYDNSYLEYNSCISLLFISFGKNKGK